MLSEIEGQPRRLPTLVTFCQRVLSTYTDSISSLGDDAIRYDVIKPVLECCSADTLLRLEQSSPYLVNDTSEIWQRLCWRTFPLLAEQYLQEGAEAPESWREQFFLFREVEAKRLELVGSRLRSQRMEADERKKEREVKITDRLPPPKRARGWGAPSQPKTLFQKTKTEATKLRTSMYTARILPPQRNRMIHSSPSLRAPAPGPSQTTKSMVTVKTVTYKRPPVPPTPPQTSGQAPTASVSAPSGPTTPQKLAASPPSARPSKSLQMPQSSPSTGEQRPSKPPINKKDPMASLFMPKHRTLSQLPGQTSNARIMPTR
ncbi:RNA polymerase II transcription factor SIII subunit A-domain-containing protein [Suillus paluster]|uniref:RNA polymerase II transcription factor SIII subunit A-domain-containing protein n=1 Tax=Suillus paluster TaxID=48578 RepID=UPI001B8760E2|nr:RNA polymerase II transcription factor SIII subunit A-domain-containing protein [Suillus paluster]KAG1733041.1 RNA polymerase II transcription factor SIII subunit A-domain-containing protein [Suillus paluster]